MAGLPAGFPKSTTAQGAFMELCTYLIRSQAIAIQANPQINRIIDSSRTDEVQGLFTFGGAIPVEITTGASGETEVIPKITF